uniref:[RNA-polymerase]-subunit kinase n=1 Tax=Zea mays TaxID=4577 RepID=A0A804M1L8_MAIZE
MVFREARFHEEACCGGANPFVVSFHGVVRDPGTWKRYLVMECMETSLHDLLHQRPRGSPPLPEATVRAAMWQLLTGTKKMHEACIIHRDIKLQNILVGEGQSVVKICDFGLAMSTDERLPYEPAGTLWYQAPELLLGKPDYDTKVDVWSLGCVMAELVNNGRPLFQGSDDDGQLCAIFDVLGVPDDSTWPWFSSMPFATEVMPELDMQAYNRLRDLRLTAAAALNHPWFAKIDDLELPKKKEKLESMLPKGHKRRSVGVHHGFATPPPDIAAARPQQALNGKLALPRGNLDAPLASAPRQASPPPRQSRQKKCLNSELWHACAGPLICLPTVGTCIVYFP